MKGKFKKFVVYLLATAIVMPLWLVSGMLNAKPAMAATNGAGGGVTGGLTINGTGTPFSLNSFMITSNDPSDITAAGDVTISIIDNTDANLQFDTTVNSVEAAVAPSGSSLIVASPITPVANWITVNVTNDSGVGESLIVSKIKIKASAGTTSDFVGTAKLQAVTAGGTVCGDIINVDAQLPTIESVETQDLNANGQLDAVKVNFSENINDSTVSTADFVITGYSNLAFASTTNGDVEDNNYIYLTFDEGGTPDTFATPNLVYGSTLADLAGNLLVPVTKTSVNNVVLPAPANLIAVAGNGEISLTWNVVTGADHYNIYYQKFSDLVYVGPISTILTSAIVTGLKNDVQYRFIVRAVGTNAIESANAWLEKTPFAPKVVLTSAPVTITPETAQAAESTVEQPTEEGQIKGEENATEEEGTTEKINWTPWIILFVLIVLAGAATGGYFYWFAGDEETQTVVKTKPETTKKPVAGAKTKGPAKKPRRW